MKVKNVILVTALFIAMFFSCTANGQFAADLLGGHSPTLAYSPSNHKYYSVFLIYDFPFIESADGYDPWGNFIAGGGGWITTYVDEHSSPVITYDDMNDRFFLVWIGGWPYLDLYGLLMNYDPIPVNPDRITISSAAGIRTKPMVTRNSVNGGYLVTWLDERTSDGVSIYGQLIGGDGELQGTEFIIVGGLSREYSDPSYSVAYDNVNQRFLVAWTGGESIHGQFINANGTLQGEEFSIGDPEFYDPTGIPHIAMAYDGINQKYLVVWDSMFNRDIFGLQVSADGSPVGKVFSISTYSARNPSVAFDDINQRFLVAWTWGFTDGQFVNPDGTLQGDSLSISHNGAYSYDDGPPALAFNPECGNFLVASVARNDAGIKGLFALRSEISYTVVGDPCPAATLTVKKKGYRAKKSSVAPPIFGCERNSCTEKHISGSEVSITAYPGHKAAFEGWTGCNTVNGNVCNVTMDGDKTVTAKFSKVPKKSR